MSQETGGPDGDHVVHVGRQPIYDRDGRRGRARAAVPGPGDRLDRRPAATRTPPPGCWSPRSPSSACEELSDGRVCFINLTRDFLTGRLPLPFDCSQAVLEVLETTDVDEDVLAGVTALAEQGYTIALDDFVFGSGHERLLDLATYVKIDMLDAAEPGVRATVVNCRLHAHLQLIAERLETPEALDLAMSLGFELLPGRTSWAARTSARP